MNKKTSISLILSSTPFLNKWPRIKIIHNDIVLDDIECRAEMTLNYEVLSMSHNKIAINLYNKNFGDDNLWDVDSSGQELQVRLVDLMLDDVSIEHLMSTTEFTTHWTPKQLANESQEFKDQYTKFASNGMLSFNGELEFVYSLPVYEFLIDKKYKLPYDPNIDFFSNKSETFHYEMGLAKISEIRELIIKNG